MVRRLPYWMTCDGHENNFIINEMTVKRPNERAHTHFCMVTRGTAAAAKQRQQPMMMDDLQTRARRLLVNHKKCVCDYALVLGVHASRCVLQRVERG